MSAIPFISIAVTICACIVLAVTYSTVAAMNRKHGTHHAPAGHPYGLFAVILLCAPPLVSVFNFAPETVLSALCALATGFWLYFANRDFQKIKSKIGSENPITEVQEGLTGYGLALKGLDKMYVDLSGIDTKTLVEYKLELDDIKTVIVDRLSEDGIEVVANRGAARSYLNVQMKTQSGPKNTGSITTLYLQVSESLSNDRLKAINVGVNAAVFSTVTVATCDSTPSSKAITDTLQNQLEKFCEERRS